MQAFKSEEQLQLVQREEIDGEEDLFEMIDTGIESSVDMKKEIDSNGRSDAENSRVNGRLLFMKLYSLSSVAVDNFLSDQGGIKSYFQVTEEQMEIIQHDKSCFILGRSGTGKTRVLIMKLCQREQRHYIASEGYHTDEYINAMDLNQDVEPAAYIKQNESMRQLFVTISPKLCYAVKQHLSQLISFARGGNFSGANLIDKDCMDDAAEFNEIPDSFRDLPADCYPLVITFQKFFMMLDRTVGDSFFERFPDAREVNYEMFCSCYWIHFSNTLTKKLDPSRVFTEIISYIKGGLQALEACDFKLSSEEYIGMAESRKSTLTRQDREKIYNLYQEYEKMKMERDEFDLADVANDIHRRIKQEGFEGQKMNFVYIDEVQDLTMSQISLFKYICGNVDEGFVFSGDTAQTIARGIDFRFQDIRALFYKVFLESEAAKRKDKDGLSKLFYLRQNFRTHDEVLQLAQSVIDLLYRFFPNLIDNVEPEISLIHGEAPVLLQPGNKEDALVTIFGKTGRADRKVVRFGAEQVILVRDDSVRKDIALLVDKKALILTILECKGLEFQDVLLYNFFASSPLKNEWRVVYQYMTEDGLSFPKFNENKHNLLSSELKQLYVAITRSKHRLWISENEENLPMFEYWKRKCLVEVRKLDDSLAQAMQVESSSSEEWRSRGEKLYYENNFEMARWCFEHAGDVTWERGPRHLP